MKEKSAINNTSTLNCKSRRAAGQALQDVVTAGSGTTSSSSDGGDSDSLQWSTFDSSVLHAYRYDYRLDTPAAFSKSYNQMTLSQSPIGKMSPTMAGKRDHRRQSKDQLAAAVRKHFKCMDIVENDVVVEFLYKVHYQDKNFRMRFGPQQSQ
ncbi:hypothetical protein GcM3_218026 [Golovinomyces cichoracearum]|uniref:Histone deacetylase complex subunit SAP30 Sin3 binding domain-containing protein n=1 Tax=Golovinomyces cichoracearum TaxID=62708 RepID=A0A420H7V9_9PEZI|nr:hypothetical protein GcM3_218026 [Golovinomyces cichoracearum]